MKAFKKYGVFAALLFGILAVVMLFLSPAIKRVVLNVQSNWDVMGFHTIFGKKEGLYQLNFNGLGFITLLLLVAGLVASFIPTIPPKVRYGLSALLLVVSGIFFFLYPGTINVGNISGFKPLTPIVLSGVFTFISAAINASLAVLDLLKKQ